MRLLQWEKKDGFYAIQLNKTFFKNAACGNTLVVERLLSKFDDCKWFDFVPGNAAS